MSEHELVLENEQLKNQILSLRKQLEESYFSNMKQLSELTEIKNSAMMQLQSTVSALRDELELMKINQDKKWQLQLAHFESEREQLENTIYKLRALLEEKNG